MEVKKHHRLLAVLVAGGLAWSGVVSAQEADPKAAEKLARKSGCFKCHAIDKKKDGPDWREIAKKYKAKPDGETTLYKHVTSNPKVKIDGKEEVHEAVKSESDKEIRNVVRWILTL